MAINTNTEDSSDNCSSPQFSFSENLPSEPNSLEKDDSSSEFNFFVDEKESFCPADELFFNGMIIPTQMKQKLNSINRKHEEELEITALTTATIIREEKVQAKSSIWRFNRSCSLNNCENFGRKKASIWSLFRSKSTGSSLNDDDLKNQKNRKNSKLLNTPSQKSHLRTSTSRILNVPPPYIAKGTSDLFGFNALFRSGSVDYSKSKR